MSNNKRLLRRFRSPDTVHGAIGSFEERSYAMRGWIREQIRVIDKDIERYAFIRDFSDADADQRENAVDAILGALSSRDAMNTVRLQLENFGLIPPEGDRMADG